jgi:hypothetical protein
MLRQWRLWWLLLVQVLLDVPPAGAAVVPEQRAGTEAEGGAGGRLLRWHRLVAAVAVQLSSCTSCTEQLEHRLVRQWP